MDATTLSRIQFGFTIGFHILWPAFTLGIASWVPFLSFMWWRTKNPIYGSLMRFWIRIFALGFGMGVVTGVVLSYEIGANWSGISRAVSNVLGPFFMYEVMTAFFLEAGFIGIVLFGENRVGRGMHFFACLMVAGGTLFSASWILASNSWMQTPGFCRKAVRSSVLTYDRGGLTARSPTVVDFKGSHFERDIVLWGVRWYVAYPIRLATASSRR
jgi:cytochrome d ubiquinol oxidase subunit I